MGLAIGLIVGMWIGCALTLIIQRRLNKPYVKFISAPRKVGKHTRLAQQAEERRIILRPTNINAPPSRITQALFLQRSTRKLKDDED